MDATDTEMHLFNIQPYVGFQWRPVRAFLCNSFGLYYAFVASAATMTKEPTVYSYAEDEDGNEAEAGDREKSKVNLWLEPNQPLGAYYGWYFNIPHFGTLGAEVQIGNRWNGSINYQYRF